MIKLLSAYFKNNRGALAPLTAVMLPLLLGVTAVGVDASLWMQSNRSLQAAADAAAIAGAWEILNDQDDDAVDAAALREAINNGYTDMAGNNLIVEHGSDANGNPTFTVRLSAAANQYFSSMLFEGGIVTSAVASAAIITTNGGFCLLSLDPSEDGAFTAVGNVDIEAAGCGIAVNSDSDSAFSLSGNVDVNIDNLTVVGDTEITGNVDLNTNSTTTGASPVPDPYADLDIPDSFDPHDCDHNNYSIPPAPADDTIYPGTYCGGISISGNVDITMDPGVYYFVDGDFTVSGNGSITAEGVTIVLTYSDDPADVGNMNISGNKDILFEAPEEGDLAGDESVFEGIAIYQDRDAEDDDSCSRFVGNSARDIIGAAYFPSRCLDIGGNVSDSASSDTVCSQIIAKKISLHGNPNIGNDCENVAIEDTGQMSVRLIL